jgi:hypothetical protein
MAISTVRETNTGSVHNPCVYAVVVEISFWRQFNAKGGGDVSRMEAGHINASIWTG